MQAVLKAQINKTDRNDARGIAQMMRVGLYRPEKNSVRRNRINSTHIHGTPLPVKEPFTASIGDVRLGSPSLMIVRRVRGALLYNLCPRAQV
jgi:hypothetical protein